MPEAKESDPERKASKRKEATQTSSSAATGPYSLLEGPSGPAHKFSRALKIQVFRAFEDNRKILHNKIKMASRFLITNR